MTFYEFMKARENIRLVKEAGAPWPWTGDPILQEYKFTNVKREHDRTTKWMRENWTKPHHNRHPSEVLFNCALFDILELLNLLTESVGNMILAVPRCVERLKK